MSEPNQPLLSVVVPLYNEADGLIDFHKSLVETLGRSAKGSFEIIYVDDGSQDQTATTVSRFCKDDQRIKLLKLSRNFGKENALSAGIDAAVGQAILTIDGDGQHPVDLIPKFLAAWQKGAKVVIGVRRASSSDDWFKRLGARVFYRLFNRLTGERLVPHSTDFRLIDKTVQREFIKLQESDRLTRGLIDWLGFKRQYIEFDAGRRYSDHPGYSRQRLVRLATHSFVSMTPVPLYLFGYLGVFITTAALILGGSVFFEQIVFNDPWHWKFSGTAMIGILILFLVGLLLMAQGMLSLYISHIHSQTKGRPLYVIDREGSIGVKETR